jgi:hypothetical protein
VSAESLNRLGVGWAFDGGRSDRRLWDAGDVIRSSGQRIWTFPMLDADGQVIGIRLRTDRGVKYAVAGGREGLFIPSDLPDGECLLICEGPTDCAALLDFGFAAVGRPSCTGGVRLLSEFVRARRPNEVVVVSDNDAPGRRGAEALACVLRAYAPRVRLIAPPAAFKDARAWKQAGASASDVAAAITAAPLRTVVLRSTFFGLNRRQVTHD